MGAGGQVQGVPYRFLEDGESLEAALASFPSEGIVGLDTETFWERAANRSNVSLVQLAAREGEILVIDVLAVGVERLRPLLESSSLWMAAHNAGFDQMVLAGAGVQPAGLVDTLRLARASLRLASYSLASVVEHLFGIALDKSFQSSNWRRRPLTKSQISYAALDALMSLRVYEELKTRLESEGKFEAALKASTLSAEPSTGEKRQRRPKVELSPPLSAEERRIVKKLKTWRLERSRTQNVPAYMVCPDRTLEHLVRVRPDTLEGLAGVHGLGASKISSFGEELLAALKDACA